MSDKTDIIVITTGGTIDKSYDEFEGTLSNRESMIKERIVSRLRLPYSELQVFSIFSKDSLDMTDYDRTMLCKTIENHLPKKAPIVILHGTDTMSKSAEYCYKNLKGITGLSVPIIFTGAMRPLGFENSDALQNVTEALHASKILGPGIYISFHSNIFKIPGVRKNPIKRTFEQA